MQRNREIQLKSETILIDAAQPKTPAALLWTLKKDPSASGKPFQHLAPIDNLVINVFFTHG
ncbi:hypothetical protein [Citrobacter pasteurii]|nr:hypothetical protein [Citrobacter pasteurii]